MNRHSLMLVVMIVALVLSEKATATNEDKIFSKVQGSVQQLLVISKDGTLTKATAIALPDGYYITNCHATQNAASIWLRGYRRAALYQVADIYHDLCKLRFPWKARRAVKLASKEVLADEEVFAIGYSGGLPVPSTTKGKVERLLPIDYGALIRTSAKFTNGASGGGLFNENGDLVGILTFYGVHPDGSVAGYFATPVAWIRRIDKAVSARPSSNGKFFWETDVAEKPIPLRADIYHTVCDWSKLYFLAHSWKEVSPNSAAAHYYLKSAEQKLVDTALMDFGLRQTQCP